MKDGAGPNNRGLPMCKGSPVSTQNVVDFERTLAVVFWKTGPTSLTGFQSPDSTVELSLA